MGSSYVAQGAQLGALYLEGWDGAGVEGGSRKGGYMYPYGWFTSLYNGNLTL